MRKLNEEETALFMSFADVGFSGPQAWVLFDLAERLANFEYNFHALVDGDEEDSE